MSRANSSSQNRPPQLRSNVEVRHRYRFLSGSGTATFLTPQSLIFAAGSMCTVANTTCAALFGSVKLNSIEMWSPPASQGSASTCSVDWAGYQNSPSREFSDTSVSVSTPARVSCRPPPMSLASFWSIASSATVLCTVVAPAGTIIDVSLSLILSDDDVTAATQAVATGTLGNIYYLSLDSNATHRFTPVSLATTI
jgi:hypothetical protein